MTRRVIDRSFALHYQADGRQVGLLGWPDGLGGLVGHRPLRRARPPWRRASRPSGPRSPASSPPPRPPSRPSTSVDQLVYREIDRGALRALVGPGAGGDRRRRPRRGPGGGPGRRPRPGRRAGAGDRGRAQPGDPDGACADYELWRRPAVRPYEEIGAAGARIARGGVKPPEERWPPA